MTIGITPTPTTASTAASTAAAGSGSSGTSTTAVDQKTLGSDFNTFLKLLTAQLRNQDPLSPLDTNQFTQQLVSFSQVEQAINSNTKLDNLIALQSADQTVAALPVVGHTVQFSDNQAALVNGQATYGYSLPATATQSIITISDASGRIVFQGPGQTDAGNHAFAWNGQGSDGSQLPDGIYTFNVAATAGDGSAIKASITAFGKVDSVSTQNGSAVVDIGGVSEPLSKIIAIAS
jgi:flagellar basal-body rod modification protein FlgD